ncbi:hypothetical protein MMC25_003664 [Agyrium rufum]|nr:hypothetical protein [Agyrium rufum]
MPPAKPKPSEIAAEAKKRFIPYFEQTFPNLPARSFLHVDTEAISETYLPVVPTKRVRVAVINGSAVDVALDWYESEALSLGSSEDVHNTSEARRIPVVNVANEKRAGGDWESGLLAPEENLFIFRSGPELGYAVWQKPKWLPVISVAPVRRPKLDESGRDYSFAEEKELMKDKMRVVLRIAARWQHRDLCIGSFGAGSHFRNPVKQVADMWRDLLFVEKEFQGLFSNVVFAIEDSQEPTSSVGPTDFEVFQKAFDPTIVFKTAHQ